MATEEDIALADVRRKSDARWADLQAKHIPKLKTLVKSGTVVGSEEELREFWQDMSLCVLYELAVRDAEAGEFGGTIREILGSP